MKNLPIFEYIRDLLKDYLRFTLEKIEDALIEKISSAISIILGMIFLLFTFSLFFVFSTVALALFLGSVLGSYYWGFLIIAVFYLIVGLLLWSFRTPLIKKPIARLLSKSIKGE